MAALQYPRVLFTRSTCGPRPVAGPLAITILFNFINFEKYSFNSLLNKFLSSSSCMQDLVFDELWWSTVKTLLIVCYHYDRLAGYSKFVLRLLLVQFILIFQSSFIHQVRCLVAPLISSCFTLFLEFEQYLVSYNCQIVIHVSQKYITIKEPQSRKMLRTASVSETTSYAWEIVNIF